MFKKNLYEISAQHISMQEWEIKTKLFARNKESALKKFKKNYSVSIWLIKYIKLVIENERKD